MKDSASSAAEPAPMDDKLAAAVAEIIATCDGDPVAAVGTVYVAYCILEEEYKALERQLSSGFVRRRKIPVAKLSEVGK